ncbi:CBS domain-containing protein [Streptomyces sp. NPDC059866]|uniref:CBS domain-containing protein n=1 Tax=Streptomyces sp. NPDC059866 TaxID=3346978 RepID=UPI00365F4C36
MELPLVVGVDGSASGLQAVDEAARHRLSLRLVYASLLERYEGSRRPSASTSPPKKSWRSASSRPARNAPGKPITIDAGAYTDEVLRAMEEHKIRRLPDIENHRLVGMISEADLARRLPEEQVGHFGEVVCAAK